MVTTPKVVLTWHGPTFIYQSFPCELAIEQTYSELEGAKLASYFIRVTMEGMSGSRSKGTGPFHCLQYRTHSWQEEQGLHFSLSAASSDYRRVSPWSRPILSYFVLLQRSTQYGLFQELVSTCSETNLNFFHLRLILGSCSLPLLPPRLTVFAKRSDPFDASISIGSRQPHKSLPHLSH